MDDFISRIISQGMGQFMDESRKTLTESDDIYLQDKKDVAELSERFESMNLNREDKRFIEDYIMCLQCCDNRYADLSYMAGIRDTIMLLLSLGVLKKS